MSLGGIYALAALGIGLIFGVLRLINFAQGDFITVGAYALILPSAYAIPIVFIGSWPAPLLIVAIVSVVVALALISERLVFRPLRMASPATMMIASIALSFLLQHVILSVYGGRSKSVGLWSELNFPIEFLGLRIPQLQIVTIVVTAALLIALVIFLKKTPYGIAMRAATEDFQMARLLGVRANTVIATAFAISGLLAAVLSLLMVTQSGVLVFRMGLPLVLFAFVATVIGGMGSLVGAAFGGFLMGFVSVMLQIVLPLSARPFRDSFVFAVVILILVIRPQGIFLVRAVQERV